MLKLIFVVLIYSTITILGQTNTCDTLDVDKFWTSVNKISNFNVEGPLNKSEVSNEEIETAMLEYYKIVAKSPIAYKQLIRKKYREWKRENNGLKRSEWDKKPGVKVGRLKRFLALTYGSEFVETIGVPYFIKGEVVGIEEGNYYSDSDALNFSKTILKIKIEDVLKGNHLFAPGQIMEISVLNFWYQSALNFYLVGKKYFFHKTLEL